jgi:hypothetical protein
MPPRIETSGSPMSITTSTGMKAALPARMSRQQPGRLLLGLGLAMAVRFYTFDSVNVVLPDMAGGSALAIRVLIAECTDRSTAGESGMSPIFSPVGGLRIAIASALAADTKRASIKLFSMAILSCNGG